MRPQNGLMEGKPSANHSLSPRDGIPEDSSFRRARPKVARDRQPSIDTRCLSKPSTDGLDRRDERLAKGRGKNLIQHLLRGARVDELRGAVGFLIECGGVTADLELLNRSILRIPYA